MRASGVAFHLLFIPAACSRIDAVAAQLIGSFQYFLGSVSQIREVSWKLTHFQNYFVGGEEGCANLGNGAFDPVTRTISTNTFCPNHFSTAPYIANGYFGQTLPSEGVGYWIERRPDGSHASNGESSF